MKILKNNKKIINNINILQGKYALIRQKKLKNEKENYLNNINNNLDNNEKDYFKDNNNKIKYNGELKDI